jgi:peptidyl-tRNA hydrolase, PTH1 family
MIKAIVGLGNSGAEYQQTYHNVGEFVAHQIVHGATAEGASLRVYPVTGYMNESGGPVNRWLKMNNLRLDEVVVAHDDSDLPIGTFKLVRGGGSAGHKGIESLIAVLGTEDFWRLRIGVRDPAEQVRQKAGDFVLRRWTPAEEDRFKGLSESAWKAIQAC